MPEAGVASAHPRPQWGVLAQRSPVRVGNDAHELMSTAAVVSKPILGKPMEMDMVVLDTSGTRRREALRMTEGADSPVGCGDAVIDGGGTSTSSVMVGRVLTSASAGSTGILEWIEAWGTAAAIDGQCRSIAIEGIDVVVGPGPRRGMLALINATVEAGAVASRHGAIDVAITVLLDDEAPIVRIVVSGERLDRDAVVRTIRLAPVPRFVFSGEHALKPGGVARRMRTTPATGVEGGHLWPR
jgi:hypothetical protein